MRRSVARRSTTGQDLLVFAGLVLLLVFLASNGDGKLEQQPRSPSSGRIGELTSPVPGGRYTSGFGRRWGANHNGSDLAAPIGTPIRSIAAGEVIVARPASGFGLWMQVRHDDGTVSVYGHMNTMDRPVGARVRAGERIATVGQRGQSTGPHLHLEIWPGGVRARAVDPKRWFAEHDASLTTSSK